MRNLKYFLIPFISVIALGVFCGLIGSNVKPSTINSLPPAKRVLLECNSLQVKDTLQKYFSKGYSLKQNLIISTQFKDLYDGTHFPGGKGLATSQYLLIFEK